MLGDQLCVAVHPIQDRLKSILDLGQRCSRSSIRPACVAERLEPGGQHLLNIGRDPPRVGPWLKPSKFSRAGVQLSSDREAPDDKRPGLRQVRRPGEHVGVGPPLQRAQLLAFGPNLPCYDLGAAV